MKILQILVIIFFLCGLSACGSETSNTTTGSASDIDSNPFKRMIEA